MKKLFLFLFILAMPFVADAQTLRFGYYSQDEVFRFMADYARAQNSLDTLRQQFDAETKRTSEEFNNKYEEFLEVQQSLAPTIRNKRQVELQEMMNRGIAFKEEAQRLLRRAEQDAFAPVRQRLVSAVRKLGQERGYAFILNADNDVLPYVDTSLGDDITETLKDLLK
ncbi:MAG: OmpH family outer membrane protein [Prevotella sp.]|nr:OmpH family outer membrane protein [Prevotella sp.]